MMSRTVSTPPSNVTTSSVPAKPPRAAQRVLSLLKNLKVGRLELSTPWGAYHFGSAGASPAVSMCVSDASVFARVMSSGDIGLAEAWMDGHWHTPDLPNLLKLFLHNRAVLERVVYGSFWGSLLYRFSHAMRRNTKAGSRHNIHAHYDLGNAFYKLWLDESMNYSSAWFGGDTQQTLSSAQNRKVQRALDEAGVRPGRKVLEIGCGWGAVAEAAALRGAHTTGLTLSTEQQTWAQQRLQALDLSANADLRLQDYRDVAGACRESGQRFDAIISIEMFEAVGREYWPAYFNAVRDCLAPGGRACIQSITIAGENFERYVQSTDFIQQYVFPGGLLPSVEAFRAQAAAAGLVVERELAFGSDYVHTLRHWRSAFFHQLDAVRAQGFDERFIRLWGFYLAYCEAAFETQQTDVVQFTLRHA